MGRHQIAQSIIIVPAGNVGHQYVVAHFESDYPHHLLHFPICSLETPRCPNNIHCLYRCSQECRPQPFHRESDTKYTVHQLGQTGIFANDCGNVYAPNLPELQCLHTIL